METGEGGALNRLEGWKQVRGGAQNSLEGWKQVRVGSELSGGMETGEGGHRTVCRDGNR
jgi:hypothetical protein